MQELQLIPKEILQKSDKILFITHLALGDFTYLQNYFIELKKVYPHIKIDLWVDEVRRTWKFWKWKNLKTYILFDWLEACSFFNKIYNKTYSPFLFKKAIKQAQKENYPIVVSLTQIRQYDYASYARMISPKGFVAGITSPFKKFQLLRYYKYKKLDKRIVVNIKKDYVQKHISDIYADWFAKFFGLKVVKEDRKPFMIFPKKWGYFGKLKFLKWGINKKERKDQKTVFINSFAKTKKRCWSMEKVLKLINEMRLLDEFYDARFIINFLPNQYENFKRSLKNFSSKQIFLFTADVNFFQLPSILSLCDLVISVETSVIHLAAALKVPVVALMRQKNPEWVPFGTKYLIVTTKKRNDWVKNICIEDVLQVVKTFS